MWYCVVFAIEGVTIYPHHPPLAHVRWGYSMSPPAPLTAYSIGVDNVIFALPIINGQWDPARR